jgi:hypothetical protein
MTVPNRAEHPNRKIGDHTTPLVSLRPDMRPGGVTYSVYEHDPATGQMKDKPVLGDMSYETGSAEKTQELMSSQVNLLKNKGKRYSITGSVNYHPDDVKRHASAIAETNMKYDTRLNPDHPDYVHSGTGRTLIQTQHQQNAIDSLGGTHGVHNFMIHNFY